METKQRVSFPRKVTPHKVKVDASGKDNKVNNRHLSSSLTIECYNYTGHVVKTLDHLGLCLIHEPITTVPDERSFIGAFVIKRIHVAHEKTQVTEMYDAVRGSNRYLEFNMDLADEIIVDINHRGRDGLKQRSSVLYFTIQNLAITENGGSIYIRDVDLVVMNQKHAVNIIHPNSPRGVDYIVDQLYEAAHAYNIEINDPKNPESIFYINLNDRVFTITPTRNTNIGEEVRIVFKRPHEPAETIFLKSIDDGELANVGIFRNYQDADKYAKKLDVLKSQNELKVIEARGAVEDIKIDSLSKQNELKLQAEQASLDAKVKELITKQELMERTHAKELEDIARQRDKDARDRELDMEKHDRALDKLKRDDYYESRSYNRKDSSESLRALPIIVGGAMALFALLK